MVCLWAIVRMRKQKAGPSNGIIFHLEIKLGEFDVGRGQSLSAWGWKWDKASPES